MTTSSNGNNLTTIRQTNNSVGNVIHNQNTDGMITGIMNSFSEFNIDSSLLPSHNKMQTHNFLDSLQINDECDFMAQNLFNGNINTINGFGDINNGDNIGINSASNDDAMCDCNNGFSNNFNTVVSQAFLKSLSNGLSQGLTFGTFGGFTDDVNNGTNEAKTSPRSSNNSSINCIWCDDNASIRCLECNEFMCDNCVRVHRKSPQSSNHSLVSLPTPIGTSPIGSASSNVSIIPCSDFICDQHNEILNFVCEYCKKLVCQCCTLCEHKDHTYTTLQNFTENSHEKIEVALENGRVGTKCIKGSIDKALAFIRQVEKNCCDLTDCVRKTFRQIVTAIEDRERFLLDFVEKQRQKRLASLHEQMAGLKSALSGISETIDILNKEKINETSKNCMELALKLTNGQRQLEQFAGVYQDLQPRQEILAFLAPDLTFLQDLQNQGGIIAVDERNSHLMNNSSGVLIANKTEAEAIGNILPGSVVNSSNTNSVINGTNTIKATNVTNGTISFRRPLSRDRSFRISSPVIQSRRDSVCSSFSQTSGIDWELKRFSPGTYYYNLSRSVSAIPGTIDRVIARKSSNLSYSFAYEGHEDGQVSRPWGICVDKMGHIYVSDRRNNRIQVFYSNGMLKLKFGCKGVGNGEFDLPAGICVDVDNRIIVVDKDNHRIQIFTSNGTFILKFGSFGKEYGQFQYPWDVAVNSRRQIVISDSRNHRIQQFDSEGRFIRQIVFENYLPSKCIPSPRGVCYTPNGNIIVSDFDNHCLYLIDPNKNEIVSAKGEEGNGFQEFNRPSGLCCDDDGRIVVADSKNQRILVFNSVLKYLWDIEIRPSVNPLMPITIDERDRTCDVALMPDGRIVFLIELSPDSKEGSNPYKRFVHIF